MNRDSSAPHVYRAIISITAAMARNGIPKGHINSRDQYSYRSIDDVLARLGPLLAKHRLCVLPRVLKREITERLGDNQSLLTSVHLVVAYDLVSGRDGSRHTIKASGEALDSSDKATAKAASAAYKCAMLQTFCVPVTDGSDADSSSPKVRTKLIAPEPVQGWEAWSADIVEMIDACETSEALDRMRGRHAALLTSISRGRPDLYAGLGTSFARRSKELAHLLQLPPTSRTAPIASEERVSA